MAKRAQNIYMSLCKAAEAEAKAAKDRLEARQVKRDRRRRTACSRACLLGDDELAERLLYGASGTFGFDSSEPMPRPCGHVHETLALIAHSSQLLPCRCQALDSLCKLSDSIILIGVHLSVLHALRL